MSKHNVPFYSNTLDNTHCFQVAIRSVLKHFMPDREFPWKRLEKMTAKKKGYEVHFVIIFNFDVGNFYGHDPGLPPQENIRIPIDRFMEAWAYPSEKATNIMAFKLS